MTTRKDGRTVVTRDDLVDVIAGVLRNEYGPDQHVAARILTALEDEGVQHDGWEARPVTQLIDIQETGDIVWTMNGGALRAWKVRNDGTLDEVHPVTKAPLDQEDARG